MKRARKKTHFVPKVVFQTAFAGVVPVCVAATACGGESTGQKQPTDAGPDHFLVGVACSLFQCMGVGVMAFADASSDATAEKDAPLFVVACIGFDGGPCGTLPPEDATTGDGAPRDGSVHDATADAPILAVALPAFGDQ
jgi:hypothetical protein